MSNNGASAMARGYLAGPTGTESRPEPVGEAETCVWLAW
jgi:hypothetical protein